MLKGSKTDPFGHRLSRPLLSTDHCYAIQPKCELMEGISMLLRTFRKRRSDETKKSYSVLPEGLCRRFSLAEINTATNNFDDDLVIGGGVMGKYTRGLSMTLLQ